MFQRTLLSLLCISLALPSLAQRYVKPESDEPRKAMAPASAASQPSPKLASAPQPHAALAPTKGAQRAVIKLEPDVAHAKASAPK